MVVESWRAQASVAKSVDATSQPMRRPGRPYALDSPCTQMSLSYLPQNVGVVLPSRSAPVYTSSASSQAPTSAVRARNQGRHPLGRKVAGGVCGVVAATGLLDAA